MTMTQAQMIIRNPNGYPPSQKQEAALKVLSSLTASDEDVTSAAALL